ncbi:MAG TPA: hypothetical protein VLX85_05155 [Stellaceae bacterium]|nr:hypothetical protein [Stellaceae bacterium]
MAWSMRGIGCGVVIAAALVAALGQGRAAPAPTVAAGGGVTLRSVEIDLPDSDRLFPGGNEADAINNNCLACHSTGMVLNQPKLSRADWQAEVDKMRTVYRAPVAVEDVPAIVDYLAKLRTGK